MSAANMSTVSMLEQTGTVIECDETSALVSTERQSACGQCGVSESCGTSTLAKMFKKRSNVIRLEHSLYLRPGDEVVIGIPESMLLRAALWAYMVPMLFMLGFAMAVSVAGYGDMFVFLASITGLYCGINLASRIRPQGSSDEIVLLRKAGTHTVNFEITQR